MACYLISTTETYRADTEAQAQELIAKNKKTGGCGELTKYSSTYKEQKAKGEVVQTWYRVTLTKNFTDEKEPDYCITADYHVALEDE